MPRAYLPQSERFWAKVQKGDGCWLWAGKVNTTQGYGVWAYSERQAVSAHRFAYVDVIGPIPDGMELDHLCRNRRCVRPDHLEAVTHAENVRRGRAGAVNAGRTHCLAGHAYSVENTYRAPSGARDCYTCRRERGRMRQEALRGKPSTPESRAKAAAYERERRARKLAQAAA